MEIQGKLYKVFDAKQVSNTFQVREFVVEYAENPEYPQFVKFQLTQDRCSKLDGLSPGAQVTVHFNLRGREWHPGDGSVKYFNTLEAWKIDSHQTQAQAPVQDELGW